MTDSTHDGPAIETDSLTKRFGTTTAIDGLDVTVPRGSVYGFLGPNGAGKSTTIDVLLDLVRPTEGSARVLGLDPQSSPVALRRRVGALPDGFAPFPELTGTEHVALAAEAKGSDDDSTAVLERVGLTDAADRLATEYSRGIRRRLGLAMALVGEPDLLLLDEPASGLDPDGVALLRRIVREERDRGATVFLSSHRLHEVERVCDRVGVVSEGRLVAQDTVESLREPLDDRTLRIRIDRAPDPTRDRLLALETVDSVTVEDRELVVACADGTSTSAVLAEVERSDATVEAYETDASDLERIFEAYAGRR